MTILSENTARGAGILGEHGLNVILTLEIRQAQRLHFIRRQMHLVEVAHGHPAGLKYVAGGANEIIRGHGGRGMAKLWTRRGGGTRWN